MRENAAILKMNIMENKVKPLKVINKGSTIIVQDNCNYDIKYFKVFG